MKDRTFIDTNILVYAFLENDKARHDAAVKLLSEMQIDPIAGKESRPTAKVLKKTICCMSAPLWLGFPTND